MAMELKTITFRIRVGMTGGSGIELDNFRVRIRVGFVDDVQDDYTIIKEPYMLIEMADITVSREGEINTNDSPGVPRTITGGELAGTLQAFLNSQESNIETKETIFTHTATQNIHRITLLTYGLAESRDPELGKRGEFDLTDSPAVPRGISGDLSGTLQAFIDGLEADIRSKEITLI